MHTQRFRSQTFVHPAKITQYFLLDNFFFECEFFKALPSLLLVQMFQEKLKWFCIWEREKKSLLYTNIKIILQMDILSGYNSTFTTELKPRLLPGAFCGRRESWSIIRISRHFCAFSKPSPSIQKRCTRSLTRGTRNAVESSGYDVTSSGWLCCFSRGNWHVRLKCS